MCFFRHQYICPALSFEVTWTALRFALSPKETQADSWPDGLSSTFRTCAYRAMLLACHYLTERALRVILARILWIDCKGLVRSRNPLNDARDEQSGNGEAKLIAETSAS